MPRVRRRSKEETRALVLDAALGLVRERVGGTGDDVVAAVLAHVRVTDVASRAGVTTGAIYQLWPAQQDFRTDLVLHVARVQSDLRPGLDESRAWFARARADGVPFEDVVGATAEQVRRLYLDDPLFRIELALPASAGDPRVQASMALRAQVFLGQAEAAWAAMLETYGRRARPPWTVRHLAVAAAAQLTGSVVLEWADPTLAEDPSGVPGWSLAARAVVTLVTGVTEPL